MKAPPDTRSFDEVRKAARRYADAEGPGWDGATSDRRTRGEYLNLVDALWDYAVGIPKKHRKRKYAQELIAEAILAYDLRMEARYRSKIRRWRRFAEDYAARRESR